jgi:hypothetical protein
MINMMNMMNMTNMINISVESALFFFGNSINISNARSFSGPTCLLLPWLGMCPVSLGRQLGLPALLHSLLRVMQLAARSSLSCACQHLTRFKPRVNT